MRDQGGTNDQNAKAGQQSHKNDDDRRNQQRAQDDGRRQTGDSGDRRGGQQAGSGNFAQDRERASEAGRKGGRS